MVINGSISEFIENTIVLIQYSLPWYFLWPKNPLLLPKFGTHARRNLQIISYWYDFQVQKCKTLHSNPNTKSWLL